MDAVFVGRASELVVLAAALAEARAGRPALVAVHGPAEIGKSALVREFIRTAADAVVLRASGDENERILPFGVLRQLTAQAGSAVPKPLGDLVAGVWPVADPLSVGAALLDLVGVMQGKGPVVLLVDDAQWADQPSLIALGFTLRRLYTDAVLTVVCVREGEEHGLPDGFRRLLAADETQKIDLGGLTPAELCALGAVLGRPALSPMAGRRLFEHTQGNPLHARALLRELPDAAWADLTRPLPRSFAMLVVGRLASLPVHAKGLVAAAAVLGVDCALDVAAALARTNAPLAALEEATEVELLVEIGEPGTRLVRFAHPLVRSAVYHSIGPARRAELHRRAATLVTDPAAALRHRAAAAEGADPDLAGELAGLADRLTVGPGTGSARPSSWCPRPG